MKANEFVKKFGINDAKCCILNCASPEDRWLMRHGNLISDQDFDDLKRLVESHNLVEKLGGIDKCKGLIQVCIYKGRDSYASRIKEAIADVESCLTADKKLEEH